MWDSAHISARKSEGCSYCDSGVDWAARSYCAGCAANARGQEGPMRGSVEFATPPCLSAPRRIPDESRKNDRRPVLPYSLGDEAREKVSALFASSSGRLLAAGVMVYRIV